MRVFNHYVGRVRARTLFDNGFKNSKDILNANMNDLAILTGFGSQIAKNIFENARKENRIDQGMASTKEGQARTAVHWTHELLQKVHTAHVKDSKTTYRPY